MNCELCGEKIGHNGKNWIHLTTNPRHMVKLPPEYDKAKEAASPGVELSALVRSKPIVKWNNAKDILPPTKESKFRESDMVLCVEGDEDNLMSEPFVGWYNSKQKLWFVGHYRCSSAPVGVMYWMELPDMPIGKAGTDSEEHF